MKITFRLAGFREIRTAPKVRADLARRARRVATQAGAGFVAVETARPRNRARAAVVAATDEAKDRSADENVLLKALDAGRGAS